ncbi:PIN/TRAM domain-containing protein [Estrella lausannensis]|uniref:Conserved putative membrane protein n=1 Tax=Estrella lausannensis TaxID=483423 RepID=A0A0H5DT35_9BACT|nr:TRAM domain-containing protein [Estrella lausannensis]CRX39518.1 Conserved putative membrane protein [Estrella lausannensis]
MDISLVFLRGIFFCLAVFIGFSYGILASEEYSLLSMFLGTLCGTAFGIVLIGADVFFRKFNLRTLNLAIIGLFLGFMLSEAIFMILGTLFSILPATISPHSLLTLKASVLLTAVYIAMMMTSRAAEEFYVSIPFVKFSPASLQKKDIILDGSLLGDARLIDLAASGLLDHHLIIPRFLITELYDLSEKGDEQQKAKAKKALEVIKKLENIPTLGIRFNSTDFPDIKDHHERLIKLARVLDANILTQDMSQIQQSQIEDLRIIKFQTLCNALKPLSQSGEFLNIKIQRYGKEPRQGVGYLDDGTMVVVNGGAEFIGEIIKVQVLSVKHTSSGRMIFCNTLDDNFLAEGSYHKAHTVGDEEPQPKNFFAL